MGANLDTDSIHDNNTGGDAEDIEGHAHARDVGGHRREVVRKHRRVCMPAPSQSVHTS